MALLLLLVLAFGATSVGRDTLVDLWSRAEPLGLVGAIALISLSQPCVAMRWRSLLPRDARRPGPLFLTGVLCVGLVFNYALPGPVGELVSAVMVRRRSSIPAAEALAALAVSRMIGLGSACAVAGVLWLVAPVETPEGWEAVFTAAAWFLLAGAVGLGLVAALPQVPRAMFGALVRPLAARPGRIGALAGRADAAATQLLDAVTATLRRGPLAYVEATLWACGGHLAVATGLTLAAWSIGAEPLWSGVVFTYAAATAGALALFLFPGSHVGWDLSFAALLTLSAGMTATDATAITVVARVQQSVIVLLGLGALWWLAGDLLGQDGVDGDPARHG